MKKKTNKILTLESPAQDLEKAVVALCARIPVAAGIGELVAELARIIPQVFFREVLTRGGWYRLGGVIDAKGQRISDDLALWVETELDARDGDLARLFSDFKTSGYRAIRLLGKTHYMVASTGTYAMDFLQIELEEFLEVAGHELFAGEAPANLEALLDPPQTDLTSTTGVRGASDASRLPLGAPYYSLRRITHVSEFLQRLAEEKPEKQNVHRFFKAWQSSSASLSAEFSTHWVLAVRENLDRFRKPVLQATPVAAIDGALPRFECSFGAYGLALYEALQGFDRQIGYPMAWFFHMLTTKAVPHAAADAVIEDVQAGFSYLPARDVKVIKDWVHLPYSF